MPNLAADLIEVRGIALPVLFGLAQPLLSARLSDPLDQLLGDLESLLRLLRIVLVAHGCEHLLGVPVAGVGAADLIVMRPVVDASSEFPAQHQRALQHRKLVRTVRHAVSYPLDDSDLSATPRRRAEDSFCQ